MSQSNSNESWYGSTSTGGRRSRADGASGGQVRLSNPFPLQGGPSGRGKPYADFKLGVVF